MTNIERTEIGLCAARRCACTVSIILAIEDAKRSAKSYLGCDLAEFRAEQSHQSCLPFDEQLPAPDAEVAVVVAGQAKLDA